jgi:TonB-dependent receptor
MNRYQPPYHSLLCLGAFLLLGGFLSCLLAAPLYAGSGRIAGKVTDAKTGEALVGANVILQGTAIGASTNIDGFYDIPSITPGSYTVVVSYLGYKKSAVPIEMGPDSTLRLNVKLQLDVVQFEEVTVTAQLEGQAQAINQQLTSNTIVNVVSADRIKELPDQNAAESIARLPGISIQRDAGEGQKVVVRGLSPKFNSITVNGERIPSTDATDRSVDLSMISPDILSGIEVFKALTPDKDADAVGGTVNLVLKRAPPELRGDFRAQTGYNHQRDEFGQYRASLSLSDRFFENQFGILLTGIAQRANRGSDRLTADYMFGREAVGNEQRSVIKIDNLNLAYGSEIRERFGGGLTMDYSLGNSDFFFSALLNGTNRDQVLRRKRYRVGSSWVDYDMTVREQTTRLLTTSLKGEHKFDLMEIDWQGSYSNSQQDVPYSHYARFEEVGAYKDGLVDDQGPLVIPGFANNNLDASWFQYASFDPEKVVDEERALQLNVKIPYRFEEDLAGTVKVGGKYRGKNRTRDMTEYLTPFAEIDRIGQANTDKFTLYRSKSILIENFHDPDFHADNFMDSQYDFPYGLDKDKLDAFYATYKSHYGLNRFLELDDYDAEEKVAAGYAMADINIGEKLTLLPGFRYEYTTTAYKGNFGFLQGNLGEVGTIRDTTGGRSYGEFLPMFHIRYRFTPWLDIRLAYTKSLSRPDYFNLVPYERIVYAEQTISRGNPDIKQTRATNYDVYVSFYSNDLGLLTLGGYYKKLQDIDYIKQTRSQELEFPGWDLTEPVNGDESNVWGIEIEIQTNLRNLPSPFDGFVINANYAYIHSETYFPYFEIGPRSPDPPYKPIIIDTFRKGTLPGQAEHIGNLSLGYEKGGFSGRVSMTYQGKTLQRVGARSELDGYTEGFARWDATLSQKITPLISLYLDVNNISNQPDQAYLGDIIYPTNLEYFGWTADLGVRIQF